MKDMRQVFEHVLRSLYSAETQLVVALPLMAQGATNLQLQKAITEHLLETQQHVTRLEQISQVMGFEIGGYSSKAMEGLIAEGSELLAEEASIILDAALIAAAQCIEHYELSAYGSARAFAELLGEDKMVQILEETLAEEKRADVLLSRIAESRVNNPAFREGIGIVGSAERTIGDISEPNPHDVQ